MRSVNSRIASMDPRTSAAASRPTSGTIIGGCGAMPAKTIELAAIVLTDSVVNASPAWDKNTGVETDDASYKLAVIYGNLKAN